MIDHCLPVAEIASTLGRLAVEPVQGEGRNIVSDSMKFESEMAEFDMDVIQDDSNRRPGSPSPFACPDSPGSSGKSRRLAGPGSAAGLVTPAPKGLLAQQAEEVETALWTALRALEEQAALCNRLVGRFRRRGNHRTAERFEAQAGESRQRAVLLRQVLKTLPKSDVEVSPTDSTQPERPAPNG